MRPSANDARQTVEEISGDTQRKLRRRPGSLIKTAAVLIGLALVASLAYGLLAKPAEESDTEGIPTVAVKRGDLPIIVSQRGSVWAMKPLEIKSEVEGWATILELVHEGTFITQKDVDDGLVLVRLDSSGLVETAADQQVSLYKAEADYTKAQEDYEIQKKQNESDIALAELRVKFAGMDLDHYLGSDLAAQVLQEQIDFTNLAEDDRLGGSARQNLRELESGVLLASSSLSNQEEQLEWTKKLHDQGYVGSNDLASDQLQRDRVAIDEQRAEEELNLFKLYTLPKDAEQLFSGPGGQGTPAGYRESVRDLDRVNARAQSRITQAEARLKSSQAQLQLAQDRLAKTKDMIEKCVIRAPATGEVIYGSSGQELYRQDSPIEEGASVQQGGVLIRIPDVSDLAVYMNVPEAKIDKLKVGQPALITTEAAPDKTLLGRVARISPMANPAQAWLNPDAKVYETRVALLETPENFIPGMSATAQIVVAQLKDVIYVPTQAVVTRRGKSFCWVKGVELPRRVMIGHSGDEYVEITDGLNPGEEAYLAPPRPIEEELLKQIEGAEEAAPQEGVELPGPPALPQTEQPPQPEQRPQAQQAAQEGGAEQAAGSEYMTDGRVDWRKIRQEMQGLSDEERTAKLQEILQKLPADQREQMQQRMSGGAGGRGGPGAGGPGEGGPRGGGGPGGGGGAGGAGGAGAGGRRGAGGGQETPSP